MAKKREKEIAKKMYVELLRSQKEIADDLALTEKTVSTWVTKEGWKAERDARINNSTNRAETIKKLIGSLADNALEVQKKILQAEEQGNNAEALLLKKESTRIAQEVGMYQKALEKIEKNFKVNLSTYLEVMDDIFASMQAFDKEAYLKTLDFQRYHLQSISQKLG